ncbi:MAG TPA: hypothetical protein VFW71_12160 [Actinomycetota bacterium]|nr:hypothetical protein [Actinomycetota bacterium]
MISRAQLIESNVRPSGVRHLLRTGELERILPDVYRIPGTADTWHQRLSAACLWGGPGTVASYRSAAVRHTLDGFEAGPIEISVPKQRQHGGRKFKVHRVLVDPKQTTAEDGIPVTNAHRTLRDLLPTLPPARAERVLDGALRKGLVSLASLKRLVDADGGMGHRGVRAMRALVNARDPEYQPSASELQTRTRQWLVAAGLDWFVEEQDIYDDDGNWLARPDCPFLDEKVGVEAVGRKYHTGKEDFENDAARRSRLASNEWLLFEVTWRDFVEPERGAQRLSEIRRALDLRKPMAAAAAARRREQSVSV